MGVPPGPCISHVCLRQATAQGLKVYNELPFEVIQGPLETVISVQT